MSEHTKEPWNAQVRYGKYCQEVGNGGNKAVAYVWTRQDGPCDKKTRPSTVIALPEGEANARLIAAAPDLLAACKGAKWLLSKMSGWSGNDLSEFSEPAALDAAIAKAEVKP